MKKNILLFVIITIISSINFCQIRDFASFYPLQIGNIWQYKVTHVSLADTTYNYVTSVVLRDTIILSDDRYYLVQVAFKGEPFPEDSLKLIKYDTLTSSIVEYDYNTGGGESIFLKLDALENQCWNYFFVEVCCDFFDTSLVFGQTRIRKGFSTNSDPTPPFWSLILVDEIGPFFLFDNQSWGFPVYSAYELVYAKVNGVEYGQIVPIDKEITGNFSYLLRQNYPNPFNSATIIQFHLKDANRVVLKIFDVLGREIATLIDEYKSVGNYDTVFDASKYAGGIYFYQISAGDFFDTKKMVLLK